MAVRPPGGDGEEPDAIEFGIAALDARLEESDVSFPATSEEVLQAVSSTGIPYDSSGRTLDLREAFDATDAEEFESKTELMNAVYPAFEEQRKRGGAALVERVRELLPW